MWINIVSIVLFLSIGSLVQSQSHDHHNGADRLKLSTTTTLKPFPTKRINGPAMVMFNPNNNNSHLIGPAIANYPMTPRWPSTTTTVKRGLLGKLPDRVTSPPKRIPPRGSTRVPGFPTRPPVNLLTATAALFTESSTTPSTSPVLSSTEFDYADIPENETLPDGIFVVEDDADDDDEDELIDLANTEIPSTSSSSSTSSSTTTSPESSTSTPTSVSMEPTRPGARTRGTRTTRARASRSTRSSRSTKPPRSTRATRTTKASRTQRPSRTTRDPKPSRTTRTRTTKVGQLIGSSRAPVNGTRIPNRIRGTRTTSTTTGSPFVQK